MLAKVLFMRVILPPLEIYCRFHRASLLLTFSSTPSQTEGALLGAPNGKPKYWEGNELTLYPNSTAVSSISSTTPTGIISLLSKLILRPEAASNHKRIQLKCVRCSLLASQNTIVSSAKKRWEIFRLCLLSPWILKPER